jgi:hypothetical protein
MAIKFSKILGLLLIIANCLITVYAQMPQTNQESAGKTYLLAIGISEYKYLPQMKSCANNAILIADVFSGNVYNIETTLLTNNQATKDNIKTKLNEYKNNIGATDYLLIYYSGHGGKNTMHWNLQNNSNPSGRYRWREESDYDESIMPTDADYNKNTHLTPLELAAVLREFPNNNIVMIIDSSYSENSDTSIFLPSFQRLNQIPRPRSSMRDFNMYGITVINSSDWKEVSYDKIFGGKIYGVFTYYLAQGISTRVAKINNGTSFSLNKIFEYSRMLTMQEVGVQHPQIYKGRNRDMILPYR